MKGQHQHTPKCIVMVQYKGNKEEDAYIAPNCFDKTFEDLDIHSGGQITLVEIRAIYSKHTTGVDAGEEDGEEGEEEHEELEEEQDDPDEGEHDAAGEEAEEDGENNDDENNDEDNRAHGSQ